MQPQDQIVCTGGEISQMFWPRMSHKWSRGFKSRLQVGHGSFEIAFWHKYSITAHTLCGLALSSRTGLVKRGWSSKWGITACSRMSLVLLSSKGPLNSNQIKLTIMRYISPDYYRASTIIELPGCAFENKQYFAASNMHTAVHHMERKPTFILPVNFSPGPDIPVPALLAPV